MIAETGFFTLLIALFLATYAVWASLYGGIKKHTEWVESARNAALLVFPALTVSVLLVEYALLSLDFSLAYVYDVSSQAMSPFLRVTALWGGQSGSVLFWAWLMAGVVATVLLRKWNDEQELMPYVIGVTMLTTAFFIGLVVFVTNPFARLWSVPGAQDLVSAVFQPVGALPVIPPDGGGLNPLLRHFGMIGHPPTTYLGFTGFVVPFAFAIAALATGQSRDDRWIRATRKWTLFAWIFLSIGLILGGRWAYDVLGWGGFWGWDPVENAMLLPWLTGTAFLHSVMITERRGMLKKWNMILIILTYFLSLFGTFITRTGVIESVHAFTKSALGPTFFIFMSFTFLGTLWLLISRWDTLSDEHSLDSFVSREAVFVLQNMLFLFITIAVLWGTIFPLLSELVTGTKITVGPPYFKQVTGPLFYALLVTMGIAPVVAWRKQNLKSLARLIAIPLLVSLPVAAGWGYLHRSHPASIAGLWLVTFTMLSILAEYFRGVRARMVGRGENALVALVKLVRRHRRRYGGYIIHLGVVMIALGFIGDANFKQETQATLTPGQTLSVAGYTLRFDGLGAYLGSDGREIVEARTTLFKGGQVIRDLNPRRDFFTEQQQPLTVPAVYSTPGVDVYVLLAGWEELGETASTIKMYVNSLINWVWIGGIMLVLGILIAAWPSGPRRSETTYVLSDTLVRTPIKPREGEA